MGLSCRFFGGFPFISPPFLPPFIRVVKLAVSFFNLISGFILPSKVVKLPLVQESDFKIQLFSFGLHYMGAF